MKYQVSASDYEGLKDEQKALYGEVKDDQHTLKIEGLPQVEDVSGLKAKNEQLLKEAKEAKDAKRIAEKKAADEATAAAQKSGDVEAINTSWQTKYDTDLAAAHGERDDAMKMLRVEKVHSKAVELATTLAVSGSADVLLPHIESRLSMEIKDGRAVAVVMDKQGKPSALTVEELGKEIADNSAFAPLIEASKAAGGGANGNQRGGAAKQTTVKRAEFDAWAPAQQSKFSVEGGKVID